LLEDLTRLIEQLKEGSSLYTGLQTCLRPGEISALAARARKLLDMSLFPSPPASRRSYPWPPV
jgi:hypothetical protein